MLAPGNEPTHDHGSQVQLGNVGKGAVTVRADTVMLKGNCLCGAVSLEVNGALEHSPEACHCSQCRKAQGSAFATNGNVDTNKFKFIQVLFL